MQTGHRVQGVPGVGQGGVYRGGYWEGVLGGLYRYPTRLLPGPIFHHILASGPYLRPYEGNLRLIYEVSEIGSKNGSLIDQN